MKIIDGKVEEYPGGAVSSDGDRLVEEHPRGSETWR